MRLSFITDAPLTAVRGAIAFLRANMVVAPEDAPAWATAAITVKGEDDARLVAIGLREWKVEPWHPRPIRNDPTYARAASRLEGEPPNGGAAPAQAWAR